MNAMYEELMRDYPYPQLHRDDLMQALESLTDAMADTTDPARSSGGDARRQWCELHRALLAAMEPAKWPRPDRSCFTEAEVVEIRESYASGHVTQQDLADIFGCSQSTISYIVNGRKHPKAGGPIQQKVWRWEPAAS